MLSLLYTAERTSHAVPVNNYIYQRHAFAYFRALGHLGNNVIELGCGSGYGMQILADVCNCYVGLDKFVPHRRRATSNTAFFKAKLPELDNIGDNSWDTVICFQVVEHIKNDRRLIEEAYRILKPGGKLLLTTPNRSMSLTRNPFHVREYTQETIHELICASFIHFDIQGVYGNPIVREYYEVNKRSVATFLQWDVFNLQQRLPAALLKLPYNIINNINRSILSGNNPERSARIQHSDFYTAGISEDCLDFFVVAKK